MSTSRNTQAPNISKVLADQRMGKFLCRGSGLFTACHQKIIEEAPAFDIPAAAREKLFATCKRAISEMGYIGVGTIELLYEKGTFFFIEMNTRIQVEHPVTEMVAGIDLIQAQIRAHAGEKIHYIPAKDPRGHSIECRINAEDPESLQRSPGKITECHFPGGPVYGGPTYLCRLHCSAPF